MASSGFVRYGANGDPLREGRLDLPELLEQPTTEEWAWALDFIHRRRWQEAVTYRETAPHEYTVRDWQPEEEANAEFGRFVVLLRKCGFADFYYRIRHIYWVVDDFKYWTMGWPRDLGWRVTSQVAFRYAVGNRRKNLEQEPMMSSR